MRLEGVFWISSSVRDQSELREEEAGIGREPNALSARTLKLSSMMPLGAVAEGTVHKELFCLCRQKGKGEGVYYWRYEEACYSKEACEVSPILYTSNLWLRIL